MLVAQTATHFLTGNLTLKLTKGSASLVNKKAKWYGYLSRAFSTLDQHIDQSDEKLFFLSRYNPQHVLHPLLPQPKNYGQNLRTTWYCPQMSMLLSNKILFAGYYFVTFISVVHSHILCVFLLFHCIVCMCVCHMFYLKNLLTYLLKSTC